MKNNKVALVTAGMDGLGTAICRRLRTSGFRVATTYAPGYATPEAWLAAQRDDGFHFSAFKVDAGDSADCAWMVQKLLADTGRLDLLVNHANLDSAFNVSKQALAPMLAQRWGRIVNLCGSGLPGAQHDAVGQAAGAAASAALQGFGRALALEVARHGITVNTVSPGYLRSAALLRMPEPERAGIVGAIPVGRLGRFEEVAALVAYLASEEAAFVTGANIAIDGGLSMN